MELEKLGLNKGKIALFNKKNINTVEDLTRFLPKKYYDFRMPKKIKDLKIGEYQAIVGTIESSLLKPMKNSSKRFISVNIIDNMNWSMTIMIFGQEYLFKKLSKGKKFLFCGQVQSLGKGKVMSNPTIMTEDIKSGCKIYPVYSKIEKTSSEYLITKMNEALSLTNNEEFIEGNIIKKYDIISSAEALNLVHKPKTIEDINKAHKRMLFDDLFYYNFMLRQNRKESSSKVDIKVNSFKDSQKIVRGLPFVLTEGQRKVLNSIAIDMKKGNRINALIQGDVGSGKTLVAILLMAIMCEGGYQSVLMAPTNILAYQHYEEVKKQLSPLGYKVGFLTADLKTKPKRELLKAIKEKEIDVIVGTHSVISKNVEFNNLGLTIVDEEHRFGVIQRDSLKENSCHTLTMSATPIPRSLASTIYGDELKVETITTMPVGRQPIETKVITNSKEAYSRIFEELKKGRQAYIVCPLIKKSDSERMENVVSVEEEYVQAVKEFESRGFKVGIVNGSMKEEEVSQTLINFKSKEYDVLVSTTIIEVGVNVPNATVILIKNAERFGFAQLHQLRGRVGRGIDKSYCYLDSKNKEKFEVFEKTTDGFEISKQDLLLRGAGNFLGVEQSGNNRYVMLMLSNPALNERIKNDIGEIFKDKKRLEKYECQFAYREGDEIIGS